jgi:hypothetical protein
MKNIILTAIVLFLRIASFSQLEAKFASDTVVLERHPNADLVTDINVSVNGLNPANGAANVIAVSLGANAPAGLTSFAPATLSPSQGTSVMVTPITIRRGSNTDDNVLYIPLQLSYNNGAGVIIRNMVVKVTNSKAVKKAEQEEDDSFFSKLTFLNAYNFDFYGKLTSNYVGVFNIYEPGRDRGKRLDSASFLFFKLKKDSRKWQWGVNAGVMKINYGLGDKEPSVIHRQENTKIRALDSVLPGKKYLRQWNRHTSTVSNSTWSFYCQPLILLNPTSMGRTKSKIYFHTHLELLLNRLEHKSIVNTVEQDTAIFPDPVPRSMITRVRTGDTTTVITPYYNGYFGGGFTFDIKLSHSTNSSLFLQFTAGATTSAAGLESVPRYRGDRSTASWNGFYLVRAAFNQRLSDATKLVIAQDIRGLLPSHNPLYATFIGLNIKLDELLKLIKG